LRLPRPDRDYATVGQEEITFRYHRSEIEVVLVLHIRFDCERSNLRRNQDKGHGDLRKENNRRNNSANNHNSANHAVIAPAPRAIRGYARTIRVSLTAIYAGIEAAFRPLVRVQGVGRRRGPEHPVFVDYFELSDKHARGRMAAVSGRRVDGRIMSVNKVVDSPCEPCAKRDGGDSN
jgi:hypothetical protein